MHKPGPAPGASTTNVMPAVALWRKAWPAGQDLGVSADAVHQELSRNAQRGHPVLSVYGVVHPAGLWIARQRRPRAIPVSSRKHARARTHQKLVYIPPAFVGSPKQGARSCARLCDGDRLCRPTPCAQPSTADPRVEERSGRAYGADAPRFRPWAKLRGGPPASPYFGNAGHSQHCRRSGGTGSGGKPDKCGGKL